MDRPMARQRDGSGDSTASLTGRLLSPSRVGDLNRSRVLQALVDHGPLSRAELAKMAGVTRATMGGIVHALAQAGIVEEGPPVSEGRSVGKPARPLWFTRDGGLTVAVGIRPDGFDVAIVNARGEMLEQADGRFDPSVTEQDGDVRAIIEPLGAGLRAIVPRDRSALLGVGIAIPGVVDTTTGRILASAPMPPLAGCAVTEAVGAATGLPVMVDIDARAQALGEKWFGKGRGRATFASIQTGPGLGVGLVLDGLVYRGGGSAGELGHTCVALDGEPCRCGLRGCWETVASSHWLARAAAEAGLGDGSPVDCGCQTPGLG